VADTGVGIKVKDQANLFKLFGMANDNKNLNPNGCGIGLTVSQKYLEKLDGSIALTSKYGKGTQTTFVIPLIKDEEEKPVLAILTSSSLSQEDTVILDERTLKDSLKITKYDSIVPKKNKFL
jgi:hypothetical protein